ncbi:MAG: hypothetical protein K2P78_13065, partial [Gemmataceae bacterium]|nr:hypothetical protein [Gemmataceae bacterium]
MERVELRKAPVHRLAVAALATAAVAGVLALYGSFMAERHIDGSPLNVARNADGLEDIRSAPGLSLLIRLAAFVLPWALGLGACWMGAEAMRRV